MKKEDLKIGTWYEQINEKNCTCQLVGFDYIGDPILFPSESAKLHFFLYTSENEIEDTACKAGYFGLFLDDFLSNYIPIKK